MQASHPDAARLIALAADVASELAGRASTIHGDAQIPPELLARLRRAGVFRILQPARFGGLELDLATFFEVQRVLSKACMAAGWLSGILGLQAWQLALFAPQAQEEVWGATGDVLISSAFMPSGTVTARDDGYVLSGQWRYSSGSPHSDWVLLGGMVLAPDQAPDYRAFLLPRKDYEVEADWQTVGLRATESHSISVREAYVPAYRTFRTIDGFHRDCPGHAMHANPLYRVPFGQLFALSIALPAVGALEGALAHAQRLAQEDPRAAAAVPGLAASRLALAEAAAVLHDCRLSANTTLAQLLELAGHRDAPPLVERARMRFEAARISSRCVQAVNALFQSYGSASLFATSPLAQAWLDINAAHLHAGNNVGRFGSQYSDAMLGRELKDALL